MDHLFYVLLAVNLLAFFLYGADKRRARRHEWRISEAVLLSVGFFGGGVGALLGMRVWRHKTRHWYFWAINALGGCWLLALTIWQLLRG